MMILNNQAIQVFRRLTVVRHSVTISPKYPPVVGSLSHEGEDVEEVVI